MIPKTHVVLAGDGLGSLHSGLAIAENLLAACPGAEVTFMGGDEDRERHLARSIGMDYVAIPARGMSRSPARVLRALAENTAGYLAARWYLGERGASLVVALGGPVASVVCRAACDRGTPIVLVEGGANASAAARSMGPYAEAVCLTYEQTQAQLPVATPTLLTGTPVRGEFLNKPLQRESCEEKLLVVLAGIDPARARLINTVVPSVLSSLGDRLDGWRVVHQCGEGRLRDTEGHYRAVGVPAVVVSHVDQMADLLGGADLVVSRAGASTVAELAASHVATILAPSSDEAGANQTASARLLAQSGACRVVEERGAEPFSQGLERACRDLLNDDLARERLTMALGSWSRPHAGCQIAELCAGVLGLSSLPAAA